MKRDSSLHERLKKCVHSLNGIRQSIDKYDQIRATDWRKLQLIEKTSKILCLLILEEKNRSRRDPGRHFTISASRARTLQLARPRVHISLIFRGLPCRFVRYRCS